MKRNISSSALLILLFTFLTACGGGGGGSSDNDDESGQDTGSNNDPASDSDTVTPSENTPVSTAQPRDKFVTRFVDSTDYHQWACQGDAGQFELGVIMLLTEEGDSLTTLVNITTEEVDEPILGKWDADDDELIVETERYVLPYSSYTFITDTHWTADLQVSADSIAAMECKLADQSGTLIE
ncbi:MAG: hypothetical protein KDJ38_09800 [Gammaproteobacteria bacterium]|nr:hypothetical protein [Gammaproteobacteria bacterium]